MSHPAYNDAGTYLPLVERIRRTMGHAAWAGSTEEIARLSPGALFQEAANEIERLRAALKTIADNDCARRDCDVYQIAKAALKEQAAMRTCRWCGRSGDWPQVCMSTRDMEERDDPICDAELMKCGGGERSSNQRRAE